ncbi:MAG TPA: DUF4424 family protein [Allosphingosinicella sp.]|nr:DUF4424 family protein [Allosphingosinicella sp.]
MPVRGPIIAAAAAALAAGAAIANDSTALKVAGGLVLTRTNAIDMVSEDLYISPERVHVAYVFRNRTRTPVRTIVAFPMPDRDLAELRESDTSYPHGFQTLVDGRPVTMRVERRAMLGGVDHTALLAGLGIPVGDDPEDGRLTPALTRLRPADRARLVGLGLAEQIGRRIEPSWTVKETYYWDQVFPAGRALNVTHSYVPGVGGIAGVSLASIPYRNSPDGRREQAAYCVDRAFLAGLDRMIGREGGEREALVSEQRLGYILTTGGNWRAPIGSFRLVVDKLRPDAIVSFCGRGVRRISPTRFEIRRRNWRPDRDLAILIVSSSRGAQ